MTQATKHPPAVDGEETIRAAIAAARPRRRISVWRRLRRTFSIDRIRSIGSTLVWVVPITILIWVWALREQSSELEFVQTFNVSSAEPNYAVSVVGPSQVRLRIEGPSVRLAETKNRMESVPLNLVLAPTFQPGEYDVDVLQLLPRPNPFAENGVTVLSAQPALIHVKVDKIVEVPVRIELPRDLVGIIDTSAFVPDAVIAKGPEATINALRDRDELRVEVDIDPAGPDIAALPAGQRKVLTNVKLRPIKGVTLSRTVIDSATLVKARLVEESYRIPAIVLRTDMPAAVAANGPQLSIVSTLTNIDIVGPVSEITRIKDAIATNLALPIRAYVEINPEDLERRGETIRRRVRIEGLPPGVKLVGDPPEVEFTIAADGDPAALLNGDMLDVP